MSHQEDSAKNPYMPRAVNACPRCKSKQVGRCRCMVGDHFCGVCGYNWRTGKLYWKPQAEQDLDLPTTVAKAPIQKDKRCKG